MNHAQVSTSHGASAAFVRRAAAIAIILSAAIPIYVLLKQAMTPEVESFAWPPFWLPHRVTAAHLESVFTVGELRASIIRSIAVALICGVAATVMGAMMGYAMARSGWGRRTGMTAVTATRLLPMIAVALPLALAFIVTGLYDRPSAIGLALVHTALALPMTALVLFPAFLAIPLEIEEAAFLDGAAPLRIFLTIDLPLARGALAAAFILSFILSWDEFGFALLLQVTNRTLPPLLYYYTVFGDIGAGSALALLMMIPAICVVIALRPVFRGALMAGSFR